MSTLSLQPPRSSLVCIYRWQSWVQSVDWRYSGVPSCRSFVRIRPILAFIPVVLCSWLFSCQNCVHSKLQPLLLSFWAIFCFFWNNPPRPVVIWSFFFFPPLEVGSVPSMKPNTEPNAGFKHTTLGQKPELTSRVGLYMPLFGLLNKNSSNKCNNCDSFKHIQHVL